VIFPQRRFVAEHPAVSGARVRKQDGRRGRDEILAEKLVPGETRILSPREISENLSASLASPPAPISVAVRRRPADALPLWRKWTLLVCARRLYIHLGTSYFTARNAYNGGNDEKFMSSGAAGHPLRRVNPP